jgi:protein TonB
MRIAALLPIVLGPLMLHAQDAPRIHLQGPPPNLSGTRSPDGAVRISGGVMMGLLTKRVMPASLPCGVGGAVVMRAIVGTDGKVEKLSLISGPPGAYSEAVMNAVRRWEYKPYLLNGNPTRVDTSITINIQRNGTGCGG